MDKNILYYLLLEVLLLVDKNICVRSRLKLHNSVIMPTVLFGLAQLPLSLQQLRQIDCVQRRMLRCIVGWVRIADEPWHVTMARMTVRVHRALNVFPVESWTSQLFRRQFKMCARIVTNSDGWAAKCTAWLK